MNKRAIVTTALVGLIVIAGGIFVYVQQTLRFDPLPMYRTTVISGRPDGAGCINKERSAEMAIELIDLGNDVVYLAGGENPVSEEEWDQMNVSFPHMKNSKRYLLFDDTCIYRSPEKPATCEGNDCFAFTELYEHTWFVLNGLSGQGCYPNPDGCSGDEVNPGYVSITTIDKCQEITFAGPTIHELVDDRGNRYVMHATDDGEPDLTGVPLPDGWHLTTTAIDEPLTLQPRGEGHCYYNIVRDANLQSYHQYVFVDETFPPAP